ncbi:hypothetical protein X766_28715 [Mesorhizobium sp. LSJC255A00]|nr:hypothetical protein X766_28715 [Mesorhizobium sp. LSJC255A00]
MTTNIDLDSFSGLADEHSGPNEHSSQATPVEIQVAQATSTQPPAPPASEPVPVDVGSGAPVQPAAPAAANAAAAPHEYVADASNMVRLPSSVSIDNIKVDGHNLLLEQADGSVIAIKDGALNVPTFIIGDVEVPRVALLAALEASHVDVAFGADGSMSAGPGGAPGSAGGDFTVPPGGIGDGFDLSALLPPTDLQFGQLEPRELTIGVLGKDSTPSIGLIGETTVYEAGLPARGGESAGSNAAANSETTSGTIGFTSPDGVSVVSLGGHVLTGAAQTFTDATGSLTASYVYNPATGAGTISYSYTLVDNTTGDNTTASFAVVVTDTDGDSAPAGNLVINIIDDVPTAHADTDSVASNQFTAEAGNVLTAVGTTSPVTGIDVLGADGAAVVGVQAGDTNADFTGSDNTPASFAVVVTDTDGDSAPAGNLVINIIDDVPTAHADTGNVNEGALLTVLAAAGVLVNDVAGADGATIDGVRAAGGNTTTAVSGGVNTDIVGLHGTLHLNVDGSYTYQSTAHSINANTTDVFVYTIKDGDGDFSTTTLTINLTDVNDAPVVASTQNWMSSDPGQQTLGTPTYPNGYPLLVSIPTDADGDNLIVTATGTIPTGVFYYNGVTYVALTTGTVLYNPSGGINLLGNLVYTPTATVTDTVNTNLTLNVFDGTATTVQTVGIHEVPPTSLPSDTAQVGNGSSPLTSGNDQVTTLALSQATVNAIIADPHSATLVVYTDFQESPFVTPIPVAERNPGVFGDSSAGSHREQEVQVEIVIGTNHFAVVEDDLTAGTFEQSWFYDPATGLMKATVDYDHIFLLDGSGNATSTTLASYLIAHPPTAGDSWTLSYFDNSGGNYQARSVSFSFFSHDPGDPGITVNGDATLADQIYGTSGVDHLSGGGGNDIIIGRGGNDFLTGGAGADTFLIGTGDSTPVIGGTGNAGTITGYDIITDFVAGTDKLALPGTLVAATAGLVDGAGDSVLTIGGDTVESHSVTNGIASFFGTDAGGSPLAITSTAALAAAVQYLMGTDIGNAGATLAFTATISGVNHTFVYTQTTTNAGVGALVDLQNVTVANLNTLIGGSVDPIILDLNHDGFAFSDVSHGVQFDINGDGTKDQIAWNTSNDGMLAIDLNHNGKIDDGTELFTPSFGGGHFASGAAALASLDSNHDGVIDQYDDAFSSLLIWKDANANGISDSGELSHLADNGIISISTTTTSAVGEIDGQAVASNGTFQMADGTTGNYIEVELNTSLVAPVETSVASDGTRTFTIGSLEVADLIADFHDGDQLDLSSLLKGLAGVTDLVGGGFVEIAQSSANAEVKVDTDGGGDNYHTVAVLENYTFHSAADAVKILYDDSHGTKTDVV